MTIFARSTTLAGLAVAAALAAVPAYAEMMSFKADLKGASEVPPVTSQGTGNVTATMTRRARSSRGRAPCQA